MTSRTEGVGFRHSRITDPRGRVFRMGAAVFEEEVAPKINSQVV